MHSPTVSFGLATGAVWDMADAMMAAREEKEE